MQYLHPNLNSMDILLPTFHQQLVKHLKELVAEDIKISDTRKIGGGSINTALFIKTNLGNFFVKFNQSNQLDLFDIEVKNLELLAKAKAVRIPKVYGTFRIEGHEFLLLQFIESGTPHYDFWRDLGTGLARLHKTTKDTFGLHFDNYIGSLPQSNTPTSEWTDFFIHQRLEPMLKMAIDSGKAEPELIPKFESLYSKLNEIFPKENPALLHGDLWSGNCMADENGDPVIYDPAVYYGHREMDLAMTRLFGGFESEFYESYHEEFPLEKHWEQRIAVCNLYPLLVHVNLFVGSYIQSIKNIVNRY